MKTRIVIVSGLLCAAFANVAVLSPASALTAKECSAKYQAAKKAGTLNGMNWNEFRKTECGASTAAAPASGGPAAAAPAPQAKTAAKPVAAAPAPVPSGNIVFPSATNPKYAKEPAGTARLKTCADQYNANKATSANGGLKWVEKGGGYWSLCNKHLKGSA